MRINVALLAAFLLLGGCDAQQPSAGPSAIAASSLPTHKDLGGGPAALLTATLIEDGDCVYATSNAPPGRWLPIWPSGFHRDARSILDGNRVVASISAVAKLGGGEYHANQMDFLRTLLDAPIPAECQASEYWLVTQVVP